MSGYTGSNSGSGNSSDAAAYAAGAVIGAGLAGLLIYGMVSGKETSFNRYIKNASNKVSDGSYVATFDHFLEGPYQKSGKGCAVMPDSLFFNSAENIRLSAVESIKSKLNTAKKTERKQLQDMLKGLTQTAYDPSMTYVSNQPAGISTFGRTLDDGTVIILSADHTSIVCAGKYLKETQYKKMRLYCKDGSDYCQVGYLHITGTKEYIKAQKAMKNADSRAAAAEE